MATNELLNLKTSKLLFKKYHPFRVFRWGTFKNFQVTIQVLKKNIKILQILYLKTSKLLFKPMFGPAYDPEGKFKNFQVTIQESLYACWL